MKRFIALFLALVVMLSLVACGAANETPAPADAAASTILREVIERELHTPPQQLRRPLRLLPLPLQLSPLTPLSP